MDWSYGLLDPAAQRLLTRLAVFSGGFPLDAAEQVCGGTDEPDVLETFAALLDASLLVTEDDGPERRFGMLETIRTYAGERAGGCTGPRDDRTAPQRVGPGPHRGPAGCSGA